MQNVDLAFGANQDLGDEEVRKRRHGQQHMHRMYPSSYHHQAAKLPSAAFQNREDAYDACANNSSDPVDFSLASTYIPGILCLLRTSLIIILMSREWATHSIPTLILLSIFLYVDRIVRQEIIFDSSALTCTVFVTHVLNICRSKIAHVDPLISSTLSSSVNSTTAAVEEALLASDALMMRRNNSGTPLPISWWWQQQIVLAAYCTVSTLLLLNIDISSPSAMFFHHSCNKRDQQQLQQNQCDSPIPLNNGLRVSTIVLHCLFVGTLLQIPVTKEDFMIPWKIVLRSCLFLLLSICWTYAVGIHDSCVQMRSYPYFYNPVLQGKFVQPFTQCQLRFLVLLFLDSWFLLGTGLLMSCIVARHLSVLVAHLSVRNINTSLASDSSSSSIAVPISVPRRTVDDEAQIVPSISHASMGHHPIYQTTNASTHPEHYMPAAALLHVPSLSSHGQYQMMMMPSADSMEMPSTHPHHQHQPHPTMQSAEQDDDMAAMFRLARSAAAGRMGEQI